MKSAMHTIDSVLVRYGEIGIKSDRVRSRYEHTLVNNIEKALSFCEIPYDTVFIDSKLGDMEPTELALCVRAADREYASKREKASGPAGHAPTWRDLGPGLSTLVIPGRDAEK